MSGMFLFLVVLFSLIHACSSLSVSSLFSFATALLLTSAFISIPSFDRCCFFFLPFLSCSCGKPHTVFIATQGDAKGSKALRLLSHIRVGCLDAKYSTWPCGVPFMVLLILKP
ncbi:hypothetical protein BJ165DRAFT_1503653 [Panaeolus papilionaceus]|nr:hypothetical protein BJ165DRAFT_1503653 [Panaeolus papilionaceus]